MVSQRILISLVGWLQWNFWHCHSQWGQGIHVLLQICKWRWEDNRFLLSGQRWWPGMGTSRNSASECPVTCPQCRKVQTYCLFTSGNLNSSRSVISGLTFSALHLLQIKQYFPRLLSIFLNPIIRKICSRWAFSCSTPWWPLSWYAFSNNTLVTLLLLWRTRGYLAVEVSGALLSFLQPWRAHRYLERASVCLLSWNCFPSTPQKLFLTQIRFGTSIWGSSLPCSHLIQNFVGGYRWFVLYSRPEFCLEASYCWEHHSSCVE